MKTLSGAAISPQPARAERISLDESSAQRAFGIAMDTLISIEAISQAPAPIVSEALQRALAWFSRVERICSRFDPESEARRLGRQVDQAVEVSPLLFEAVRFALGLAEATSGAFDPTVGLVMERSGFDRNYRTGERVRTDLPNDDGASYRDLTLDQVRRTVIVRRPLVLDLGALAKGLAIDLAARELRPLGSYCIEAGGDIFAGGFNARGRPWQIGVRDPNGGEPIEVLQISNLAVCTSGDYERRRPDQVGHHLIDARSGRSADELRSVSVVAPTALAADGLSTAAFVLGTRRGQLLLEREQVEAVLVSSNGAIVKTGGRQKRVRGGRSQR